jgi:hypothetical protein
VVHAFFRKRGLKKSACFLNWCMEFIKSRPKMTFAHSYTWQRALGTETW